MDGFEERWLGGRRRDIWAEGQCEDDGNLLPHDLNAQQVSGGMGRDGGRNDGRLISSY